MKFTDWLKNLLSGKKEDKQTSDEQTSSKEGQDDSSSDQQ